MQKKFRIFRFILLLLAFWFILHSLYITVDGLTDKKQNADVAVILGNKIETDGSPSKRLAARLEQGIKLYNEKRVKRIIVSGGFGKEGYWEGNKMMEYLTTHKIPAENIIVDNYGNNTEKTVKNTIRIMDSLHLRSAISVSQYFHQTRAKKLFQKNGLKKIDSSSPQYFELRDFYAVFREFFAFYTEAL